mgnify:CR=1 FL=1
MPVAFSYKNTIFKLLFIKMIKWVKMYALIANADLIEKASVIGRVGLIMLSCGTGAWRVRTSMNKLSKELGVTCTVDVGLMSIEFNCFDGNDCVSQSLYMQYCLNWLFLCLIYLLYMKLVTYVLCCL